MPASLHPNALPGLETIDAGSGLFDVVRQCELALYCACGVCGKKLRGQLFRVRRLTRGKAMGGFLPDHHVPRHIDRINHRFSPDDGIKEMAALHKQFNLFSGQHSLRDAFKLLNIASIENWAHRRKWFDYLHFTSHSSSQNPGVFVKKPHKPLHFSTQEYLTISLPMTRIEKNRQRRRRRAGR
jgi:hypothetical protein